MTNKISIQTINRELMRLTGVEHALMIMAYDVTRDEWTYRWIGDGRTVGFRLLDEDLQISIDDLERRFLRDVAVVWRDSPAAKTHEAECERLKDNATAAGLRWCEDRVKP